MGSPNKQHPGEIIRQRFLEPLGIDASVLAQKLRLQGKEVEELLENQRNITADWAFRLGLYFDVPSEWWLEMQNRYDLEQINDRESLRKEIQPYEGLAGIIVTPNGIQRIKRGDQETPTTISVAVSKNFVERLRAQAKLGEPREERKVEEVQYENGAIALIGIEK
ncbi:HigA family addiction module antitoxin [Myxococcota bacterium]|nr:HigA family addiction module antitoxin [Myxococcota bacterium]